jgi:hypothetical protein
MFKRSLHYFGKSKRLNKPDCCAILSDNGIYQGLFTDYHCYAVNSVMKIFMIKINLGSEPVTFHYNIGELTLRPGQSKVNFHMWKVPYDYKPGYYCIEGYDDAEELSSNKFYIPVTIVRA